MDTPKDRRTLLELVLFSLAVISTGLALQAISPDQPPHGLTGLGDLSAAHIVEIRDGRGAVVLSGNSVHASIASATSRRMPSSPISAGKP